MKFAAKLEDSHIALLGNVVTLFEKIGHESVVLLNEACIRFAVTTTEPSAPKVYAELMVQVLFSEYRIESQSSNSILLEVDLHHLAKALTKSKQAAECIVKLMKRGDKPILCFESRALEAMNVTHDVPIRLLRPSDITLHLPPEISPPVIALELPRNRLMKTIVEKLGKMSKHIFVDGEQAGRLIFRVENAFVGLKTYFSNVVPRLDYVESAFESTASVKIDARRMSTILNYNLVGTASAVLCISENEALVLHVTLIPADIGSITFYLPVILSSDCGVNVE